METFLSRIETWDSIAVDYDRINRPMMVEFVKAGLKSISIDPTWRVLDVASGPGTASLYISEFVDQVDAVDFSGRMIAQLKQNIKTEQIDNIFPVVADGQNLPFDDDSFDLCLSMFGLIFFPDRGRGLAEAFRVLKPGGQVMVSSWAPMERSNLMQTISAALHAKNPNGMANEGPLPLGDEGEFAKELKDAGFSNLKIESVYTEVEVGKIDQFWSNLTRSSAHIRQMKEACSEMEWSEIENGAIDYLKTHLDETSRLGSEAFIATATKL